MRIVIGAIILLFGIIAFGAALADIPPNASPQFMLGYFLPSGGVIVLGVIVITWRREHAAGQTTPSTGKGGDDDA